MILYMFEKTTTTQDERIDNLIGEFREFKNKRKITELDLEKKILTLENIFEKLEKNIEIIQDIENADALKDIKNAKETLMTLEDLTIADRLEIIENKESAKDISDKLAIFNNKIDLMSNALKIFDAKIKNTNATNTKTTNDSDLVTVLDELSKIKVKISTIEENKPIGEKEFKTIHLEFEKVNGDFAELISSVREEIDIYDKKIENLINEIKCIKDIDSDIGKSENKYLGMLNIIKKIQEISKQLELKSNKNEIRIDKLEKNIDTEIDSQINALSERLNTKITSSVENMNKINDSETTLSLIDTKIQDINNRSTQNINTKVTELNSKLDNIISQIENEKTNTNLKISDAMDVAKQLFEKNKKTDINLDNKDTDEIKKEINKLKLELTEQIDNIKKIEQNENLQTKINELEQNIKNNNGHINTCTNKIDSIEIQNKTLINTIMQSINTIKTLKEDVSTLNKDTQNKIEDKTKNIINIKDMENINTTTNEIKNEISKRNDYNLETIKNNAETINKIQTKINKTLKENIDNLNNKIKDTKIGPTTDKTKDMIQIISLLKDENKILSKEIKMLNERLDRMEHSGQTENSAPLILE